MATTYKLIGSQTVGAGGATSIEFTSIPANPYTDLLLAISARSDRASYIWANMRIRFNGATDDTNLSSRYLQGNGSAASTAALTYGYVSDIPASMATSNTFSSIEIYLPNFAGSNNKSYTSTGTTENYGIGYIQAVAGLWSNASVITSLKLVPVGNFVQHSSFFLYGITKA